MYLYLVLRYHPTSIGNLKNKVAGLFESVSFSNGVEIEMTLIKEGILEGERPRDIFALSLEDDTLVDYRGGHGSSICKRPEVLLPEKS